MKKPTLIAFDYGQTIIDERPIDFKHAFEVLMSYAVENKYHKTAEEVYDYRTELRKELVSFQGGEGLEQYAEWVNEFFLAYLFESLGIKLSISYAEAERIFWKSASAGKPAEGIMELLDYLHEHGIRTAVLSNNAYSQAALIDRIEYILPYHYFECILSTCDYMFRKPHPRIYKLLLEKVDLNAEAVWYCGDSVYNDVKGSINVGIQPVWYTGASEHVGECDVVCIHVKHWHELIELLEGLDS